MIIKNWRACFCARRIDVVRLSRGFIAFRARKFYLISEFIY